MTLRGTSRVISSLVTKTPINPEISVPSSRNDSASMKMPRKRVLKISTKEPISGLFITQSLWINVGLRRLLNSFDSLGDENRRPLASNILHLKFPGDVNPTVLDQFRGTGKLHRYPNRAGIRYTAAQGKARHHELLSFIFEAYITVHKTDEVSRLTGELIDSA